VSYLFNLKRIKESDDRYDKHREIVDAAVHAVVRRVFSSLVPVESGPRLKARTTLANLTVGQVVQYLQSLSAHQNKQQAIANGE
jgi:hypothetical protein